MGSIGANRSGGNGVDFSATGTYNFDGQEAPQSLKAWNSIFGTNEINQQVPILGTDYQVYNNMGGADGTRVIGHTFVPIVNNPDTDFNKGSFFMDSKDGKLYHDAGQYLNKSRR